MSDVSSFNTELSVCRITPDDWMQFQNFRLFALQSDPLAFSSSFDEEKNRTEDFLREKLARSWAYAAVLGKKYCGMVRFTLGENKQMHHRASATSLFVSPDCRGRGFGTFLMNKALEDIRTTTLISKVGAVVNTTQGSAINLMRNLGFKDVGLLKKEANFFGAYYDYLCMELIFPDHG